MGIHRSVPEFQDALRSLSSNWLTTRSTSRSARRRAYPYRVSSRYTRLSRLPSIPSRSSELSSVHSWLSSLRNCFHLLGKRLVATGFSLLFAWGGPPDPGGPTRLLLADTLLRHYFVKRIHKRPDSGIHGHLAVQDVLCIGRFAINFPVHILIHIQNRAVERNAGEESPRARIRIDCGTQSGVHSGFSFTADRSGGNASVDTKLQILAAHEQVQSIAVGKDQDEVGRTAADLRAEASTADFNKGWCAPATTVQTLGYHSLAVTATDAKCAFDHMRNHSNGFGTFQQFIGNPLVGRRRQILQNGCRFGDTAGPIFVG